jgi:hypothetical protein
MTEEKVDLSPKSFEPCLTNRWVLVSEDIDAFLVKSIVLPKVHVGHSENLVTYESMKITCYNTHDCDVNGRLLAWMKCTTTKNIVLKFVNPVGKVTEQWTMKVFPNEMSFDDPNYDHSNLFLTHITLCVLDINIEFPA